MKSTPLLLLGVSLAFVSCTTLDPEYAAYKKQQEAEAAGQTADGRGTDPYGSQVTNPYGVPGSGSTAGSEVGTYTPSATPPYQPLPGVPANTPNIVPSRTGFPTIPSTGGTTTTHIVAKGDSLWGLSRKYGTSVEAIKQANGLTSDTIVQGRTLQIPR